MKKLLINLFAVGVFTVCCMIGITAYAQTDISTAIVTLDKTSYTYTGEACAPNATVTLTAEDGTVTTLVKDVDYTVAYSKNKNVGTATAKITGVGEYSGTVTSSFAIEPVAITKASFTRTVNATTTTLPVYTVTFNGKTLKEGTDYTFAVTSLDKCGTEKATVTFTGLGNFKDVKTSKISVYPSKVTALNASEIKDTSYVLSWDSQAAAKVSGYKIYSCNADLSNVKLVKTVSATSAKITVGSATAKYYIVRAYVNSGDKTLYGEYSDAIVACTKPSAVVLNTVAKSTKKGKLAIKWTKTACSGYEVQYTTDKKFKSKINSVNVSSTAVKKTFNVNDNKVYYARVRAYFVYGDQIYYGAWSSKLSNSFSKVYSSYTTNYVNKPNRTTNLKLACKAINGTILQPGEVFSFNATVGERTAAKGYKKATIFTGTETTSESLGGGVCQVASTMFNAALIANLDIVERHQHSQRVAYCPLGRDAAIYWGSENFRFKNTTKYPIKIVMKCANGKVSCTLKVCYDVSPKKVKLNVNRSGNNFTLKRTVGGKVNYTTKSKY